MIFNKTETNMTAAYKIAVLNVTLALCPASA